MSIVTEVIDIGSSARMHRDRKHLLSPASFSPGSSEILVREGGSSCKGLSYLNKKTSREIIT